MEFVQDDVLHLKNKNGDSPVTIIKRNLEKIKKLRNKNAEVFEEEILNFLEDPSCEPFNIDHHDRKRSLRPRQPTRFGSELRSR